MEGSTIFLSGVTGFIGKVILEEVFRRQDELHVKKVVVILRSKRGRRPVERFLNAVTSSQCFQNLAPGWLEKVEVVEGELTAPRCGMEESTYQRLQASVTHIIHCAGSVKFDSPLADAAASNIYGGLNILQFASECFRNPHFVHVSTAYVTAHSTGPILETLPPLPKPASELYDDILLGRMSEEEMLSISKLPNTYTLTKAITEHLMFERRGSVPLTIIRPSIVSASRKFPFPGWIDSQAAFAGFVCAIGGGMMHVLAGNPESILDIIPVDDVARLIIDRTLIQRSTLDEPIIIHSVAGLNHGIMVGEAVSMIVGFFQDIALSNPPSMAYIGSRNSSFYYHEFVQQTLPMKLASIWCLVCRDYKKSRMMGSMGKRLSDINVAFSYFTHKSFDFQFSEDLLGEFDAREYVDVVCYGALQHLIGQERFKPRKYEIHTSGGRVLVRSML